MYDFIASVFSALPMKYQYLDYPTMFVEERYHTYCLFLFVKSREELLDLMDQTADIYADIRGRRDIYRPDMEKNIIAIYCLRVSEDEYYAAEKTGTISPLSRAVCRVEEDLQYFKKNVLLYTPAMEDFVKGKQFQELCKEYLTRDHFQKYKNNGRKQYPYDLLMNLFIKIPSLSFQGYREGRDEPFCSAEVFVDGELAEQGIDRDEMEKLIGQITQKSEEEIYEWLDTLTDAEDALTAAESAKEEADEGKEY